MRVGRDVFLVGAATKPRQTARAIMFIGLGVAVLAAFLSVHNHSEGLLVITIFALPIAALFAVLARFVGGVAGMGMEAAQDVIHDRFVPGQDVGHVHWRYDPYTGKPLNDWQYDPYTGERIED